MYIDVSGKYLSIWVLTCTQVAFLLCMYTHVYTYIYIQMLSCICMHVCIYTYIYMYTIYVHIYTGKHKSEQVTPFTVHIVYIQSTGGLNPEANTRLLQAGNLRSYGSLVHLTDIPSACIFQGLFCICKRGGAIDLGGHGSIHPFT